MDARPPVDDAAAAPKRHRPTQTLELPRIHERLADWSDREGGVAPGGAPPGHEGNGSGGEGDGDGDGAGGHRATTGGISPIASAFTGLNCGGSASEALGGSSTRAAAAGESLSTADTDESSGLDAPAGRPGTHTTVSSGSSPGSSVDGDGNDGDRRPRTFLLPPPPPLSNSGHSLSHAHGGGGVHRPRGGPLAGDTRPVSSRRRGGGGNRHEAIFVDLLDAAHTADSTGASTAAVSSAVGGVIPSAARRGRGNRRHSTAAAATAAAAAAARRREARSRLRLALGLEGDWAEEAGGAGVGDTAGGREGKAEEDAALLGVTITGRDGGGGDGRAVGSDCGNRPDAGGRRGTGDGDSTAAIPAVATTAAATDTGSDAEAQPLLSDFRASGAAIKAVAPLSPHLHRAQTSEGRLGGTPPDTPSPRGGTPPDTPSPGCDPSPPRLGRYHPSNVLVRSSAPTAIVNRWCRSETAASSVIASAPTPGPAATAAREGVYSQLSGGGRRVRGEGLVARKRRRGARHSVSATRQPPSGDDGGVSDADGEGGGGRWGMAQPPTVELQAGEGSTAVRRRRWLATGSARVDGGGGGDGGGLASGGGGDGGRWTDHDGGGGGKSGSGVGDGGRRRGAAALADLHDRSRWLPIADRAANEGTRWPWRRPIAEDAAVPTGCLFYLVLLGIAVFPLCHMVTLTTRGLVVGRDVVTAAAAAVGGPAVALAVTTALRVAAAVGALGVTRALGGRYAAGSGVPEIKCFLAGTYLPGALSGGALVAKAVGLPLALASGLSYGVMGPYASMAVILSSIFGRLRLFPALAGSARAQMMACAAAAAAGIGATFGTPIGATLLTIELAAATFPVHWLPLMLYTVVAGYTVTLWVFDVNGVVYFALEPPPEPQGALLANVALQVALGVLCGLAGAGLVRAIRVTSRAVAAVVPPSSTRWTVALVAAFVTAHTAIAWSLGGVMWAPSQRDGLLSLFNTLADSGGGTAPFIDLPAWMVPPPDAVTGAASPYTSAVTLAVLAVVKWVLTVFSLVLPLPAGSFLPIFQTGAAGGRAAAEALRAAFPGRFPWLNPRVYAVLGAAGLTTGAIQTVSIGMVMVELTGGGVSILSLTVSGVTAYVTARALTHDLFSDILRRRRLPYVYGLRERTRGSAAVWRDTANLWTAADLVAGAPPATTAAMWRDGCPPPAAACGRVTWPGITVGEVCGLLATGDGGWTTAAVVESSGRRVLLGAISRHRLQRDVDEVIAAAVGAQMGGGGDGGGGGGDGSQGGGGGEYGATTNSAPPGVTGLGSSADAAAATQVDDRTAAVVAGTPLPLLATYDPAVGAAAVNPTPFTVCGETPFWKVAHFFTVLYCAQMFVVDRTGVYIGVLSKARFIDVYYALSDGGGRI